MSLEVIISCAVSLDGCLDDTSPRRLRLSSDEDWRQVERLRAGCDAILVGAGTIRRDNPSLVERDETVLAHRVAQGMERHIVKVTVTSSGGIDPRARFFTEGEGRKIVFATHRADVAKLEALEGVEIVRAEQITASFIRETLAAQGFRRLMVEGGESVLSMFFAEGVVDRFRLAVAPFFVGEGGAPRLVGDGAYPWNKDNRLRLEGVQMAGDTAVMNYSAPEYSQKNRDAAYLNEAIEESRKSAPCPTCYRVGAVVVTREGAKFRGYTHQTDPVSHAEEEAIARALASGADLRGAAIYCSMEPCSKRSSKSLSCSELIVRHGFSKVVFALAEPSVFVECRGAANLESAGVEVVRMPRFAPMVIDINRHILGEG